MEQSTRPLIRASILAIMLFQVAALFARQFFMRELAESGFDATFAKHLSYLVVPVILLMLMWPILQENRVRLFELLRRPRSWSNTILGAVGLGLMLRLAKRASTFALTSFGMGETASPDQAIDFTYYLECPQLNDLLLAVVVMSLLTPVIEEIINRGLILGSLSNRDPRIAIVITAVLFIVLHEPSAMPGAFVFGLFAGALLLRGQNLWAPIIAHGTYNFLTVVESRCLNLTWLPEPPTAPTIVFGAGMSILVFLFLGGAIWLVARARPETD